MAPATEPERIRLAVIIPYYQVDAGILSRALAGVAAQVLGAGTEMKVYVIDDASPHPAASEVSGCLAADTLDLSVVRQPNQGPGVARNRGLDLAQEDGADFIAFLDSDDIWKPRHIADALEALRCGYDFYCCDNSRPGSFDLFSEHVSILNNGGVKLAERSVLIDEVGPVRGFVPNALTDEVTIDYISHTSTVVLRAEIVAGIRFDADLRNACEDRMFWMQLAIAGARIAISWRRNVECGRGVNLFFDAYDWNAPGTIDRLGCQLLFAEKLMRQRGVSPRRRAFGEMRARDTRSAYAFLFVRMLLRMRLPPFGAFRRLLGFDPLLPAKMPALFLKVLLDPDRAARHF